MFYWSMAYIQRIVSIKGIAHECSQVEHMQEASIQIKKKDIISNHSPSCILPISNGDRHPDIPLRRLVVSFSHSYKWIQIVSSFFLIIFV